MRKGLTGNALQERRLGMFQRSVIYESGGGAEWKAGPFWQRGHSWQLAIEALLSRQPRNQGWADHKPLVLMMFCTADGCPYLARMVSKHAPDVSTFASVVLGKEEGVGATWSVSRVGSKPGFASDMMECSDSIIFAGFRWIEGTQTWLVYGLRYV